MPSDPKTILIRPFRPEDQKRVKDLILAGLAEHWGNLDPSRNPDLDDITTSYAGTVFLVACIGAQPVGTGALLHRAVDTCEIVRMSVEKSFRRRGIGRLILNQLLQAAQQAGYQQVVLETTATWQEALDFYTANGFQASHCLDGDQYFRLDLFPSTDLAQAGRDAKQES